MLAPGPPARAQLADTSASVAAHRASVDERRLEAQPGIAVGRMRFLPHVEAGIGYDTNLDRRSAAEGSRFEKLDVGLGVDAREDGRRTRLRLDARAYKYDDLTVDDRFEIDVRLDSEHRLSSTEDVRLGTSYTRDAISLDRADIYESFLRYDLRSEALRVWLRLYSDTQLAIPSPFEADLDPEDGVFDPERDEALDYTRNGFQSGLVPWPKAPIAPLLRTGYARVVFIDQGLMPELDRRAHDLYAVGGARITLGRQWRIDAGWRFNHRLFADEAVPSHDTDYPDLRVEWTPSDDTTVIGRIERTYEETTSVFALADDVRSYTLSIEQELADRLTLVVDASYEQEIPVADIVDYDKYELRATLFYRPSRNLELFAEGLARYVEEHTFQSDYERLRGEVGARWRF